MQGWRREMLWADTGLTWIPTSPHIPRADSAMYYAATGIFGELHVLSEGVGYPLPFELAGAPGLNPQTLADALNSRHLAGVFFRPTYFQPFYGSYAKQSCGGVHLLFTDPRQVELTALALHIMDAARQVAAGDPAGPKLDFFADKQRNAMFDKVCGTDGVRKRFEQGRSIEEILAFWRDGVGEFKARREKYLLYK